ncbi:aminotransferase [Fusarium mexicanum]|uniref:Aminotransferase n=1 Tax=Fusarium mexicanum TaxID=751941 RepID=A0A8H5MV01_9HYPO|nr:aminotransferase [Fusarium mexicanum]
MNLYSFTKDRIDLLRGCPMSKLLPADLLSSACQRVLANPNDHEALLNYGQTIGYQPLREALATWLSDHYQVTPDPNRICVTGGASQSLACVLQSFTDPAYTRAIWMVAPCYFLAASIFEDSGFANRLKAVSEDDDGLNTEELEQKLIAYDESWTKSNSKTKPSKSVEPNRKLYRHIIYLVPTCGNPSGRTMPVQRRKDLVKLARKYDALVICDDVYDFLQWPRDGPIPAEQPKDMRIPRLCDIDRDPDVAEGTCSTFGNAISNGSFSKLVGPGVRTGWVEATPAFAKGLSTTGSSMSGGPPSQLCAAIMADLLQTKELQRHLDQKMKPALQRRELLMCEAIRNYLIPHGVQITPRTGVGIGGGYFMWLQLGPGQSANILAQKAMQEENVLVGNGNFFSVRGDSDELSFDNNIRLCFSWESEERIVEGVRKLGEVLSRS